MRLSIYFDSDEFRCHDGTPVPPELKDNLQGLVDLLTDIRHAIGTPLAVISGYRTKAWNDRVGGAASSTHMTAEGADVRPGKGMTVEELHDFILKSWRMGDLQALGGLGLYPGWVHIDTRRAPDGHLRRWKGGGVGSEQ